VDVEPIISPELWDLCNGLLVDSSGKRKPVAKRPTTLFSGLTFCHCGQKMYLPGNSPKYTCQKCRNKIHADDLETVYISELKNFFTSRSQIEKSLVQASDAISRFENELQAKQQELQKVHQERETVYRLHVDGKITADQFGERYQPLDKRKKELGDEVARLEAEVACQRVNNLSADQILEEASTLYGRWATLDK
jgi:site-specific DNA recombinase